MLAIYYHCPFSSKLFLHIIDLLHVYCMLHKAGCQVPTRIKDAVLAINPHHHCQTSHICKLNQYLMSSGYFLTLFYQSVYISLTGGIYDWDCNFSSGVGAWKWRFPCLMQRFLIQSPGRINDGSTYDLYIPCQSILCCVWFHWIYMVQST